MFRESIKESFMLKALSLFYDTYKSAITIAVIVGLVITLGTCALKRQDKKGVRKGKDLLRVSKTSTQPLRLLNGSAHQIDVFRHLFGFHCG